MRFTRDQIYLLPETTKTLDKLYGTIVFKALDIGKQRTVIPEKWEKIEMSLTIAPAYSKERFLALVRGVKIQAEPS